MSLLIMSSPFLHLASSGSSLIHSNSLLPSSVWTSTSTGGGGEIKTPFSTEST